MLSHSDIMSGRTKSVRPEFISATEFTFDQLAHIYSQARTDYIVPMPMNGRRMQEYVRFYDVDLAASLVACNDDEQEAGIAMLGVRGQKVWLTRLGIIPERRRHHMGQRLVEEILQGARLRGAERVQLEVIQGNEPAYRLFVKLGFTERRHLLVIRRPPAQNLVLDSAVSIDLLDEDSLHECLDSRHDTPSWIDDTPSLRNAGGLHGLRVTLRDGRSGWIVYRAASFQLSHFSFESPDPEVTTALLTAVHTQQPEMDTKIENLPADSPHWAAYQKVGYVESFRRIEMLMHL